MPESEAILLRRYAQTQDPDAFRALVDAHQHMVYGACVRVLRNRADAEDAAQECFFRLATKADKLVAPIAGWLHTVAVQGAIDILRRRKARRTREVKAAVQPAPRQSDWEDIKPHVDRAIAALPERLRTPLVLYYLEGRTQAQVGAEMDISQPAVSGRLKRGVVELRRHLENSGVRVSGLALAPLLSAQAVQTAPATLTAALGKMALAGVRGSGAAVGTAGVLKVLLIGVCAVAAVGIGLWMAIRSVGAPDDGQLLMPLAGVASPPGPTAEEAHIMASSARSANADTVLEWVVGGDLAGTEMFVDFDTSTVHSMPLDVAEVEPLLAWMRNEGIDAFYQRGMAARALIGADLSAVRAPNGAWERAMQGRLPAEMVPPPATAAFPVYLEVRGDLPATFVVRTREGEVGVLQLLEFRGSPGSARVRYLPVHRSRAE